MNRALAATFAAILLTVAAGAAETLDAGPFSVDVTPELVLRYGGETLISGDRCVSFRGMKPGEPVLVDAVDGRVIREGNTITVLASKGRNTLRREVMVTAEGVHITFEMQIFGDTGGSHLQYDLLTPAEFLDGVDYEVWTGAPRGPLKTSNGTFDIGGSEPSDYLVRGARYFILNRPEAACSLDFNPVGAWVGETNYGENYTTNPYHDGERFHFLMLCSGGRPGGIFRGKIIIRPGATRYEALHSTTDVAYTRGFPVALALNFSETAEPGGDYQPYSGDASCRWVDAEQVRIIERATGGILYRDFAAAADDEADGLLELAQRSGHYLLTLNVHDANEATGPFTVSGPDGPLFEDVTVARGEYWVRTAPLKFRDGQAQVRFAGDWKICGLTLQPILYEAEDFILDRPFWNMAIEMLATD